MALSLREWENGACRAALESLVIGSGATAPLPRSQRDSFGEFVDVFLSRRADGLTGASAAPSSSSRESQGDLPDGIKIPQRFDRRYCVNFSVRFGPQPMAPRNEAEATHELREDIRTAIRAGLREVRRQEDRDMLEALLGSSTGVVTEIRQLARSFLDFQMRKQFKAVRDLLNAKKSLPISSWETQIVDAVATHDVILVAGDTGCGKSTQVPQFLLRAGYRRIACTQPRRVAALALCRRVARETFDEFGDGVGYQIRFEASRSQHTRILFLTEGLLLRQLRTDPTLSRYDVVIVDEVHERHLPCDLLLAILKVVVQRRNSHTSASSASSSSSTQAKSQAQPHDATAAEAEAEPMQPLKLVLMSATLNAQLFSDYFSGAPVIEVPGRMFPVRLEYLPSKADLDAARLASVANAAAEVGKAGSEAGKGAPAEVSQADAQAARSKRRVRLPFDPQPYVRLLQRIDKTTPQEERGDLLVFLSGMTDMGATAAAMRSYVDDSKRWIVLLLHSALDAEEQDRVFDPAPKGVRKCVLATNIAESSVTIDGIRFVADSGRAKELTWDPISNTRALQEFWVSRASAQQRKGRAGRTGPGVCFRMFAEEAFEAMERFAEPEVKRAPLEGIVLELKELGARDIRAFPFITPPPALSKGHTCHYRAACRARGGCHSHPRTTRGNKSEFGFINDYSPYDRCLIYLCQ